MSLKVAQIHQTFKKLLKRSVNLMVYILKRSVQMPDMGLIVIIAILKKRVSKAMSNTNLGKAMSPVRVLMPIVSMMTIRSSV